MKKNLPFYRSWVLAVAAVSLATAAPCRAADVAAMIDAADPQDGAAAFEVCAACHSTAPDEPTLIGPNLWEVAGRDIASKEGFAYSPALRAVEGVWTRNNFDAFLRKPAAFAPGTIMGYAGIPDDAERASVIAYLETLAPGATAVAAAAATVDYGEDWPTGAGADLTGKTCSVCHSLAIVKQQGLSRERWDKLLGWMVEEQGMTEPSADQRTEILDYLSAHFASP